MPVFIPPLAAALIVLLSAGFAWTVATPLVRAAESATLPERMMRWSGQHRFVCVLAYLPLALSGWHALWAIPLAWLGLQIATHRVRRRIFGDTWSFAGQVWWNARAFVAVPGLWLTLAFAPAAMLYVDASPALVLAVGLALAAWLFFYNDAVCTLLGARPIDAPALLEAFGPVLSRARIRRPRLVHAGPAGGKQINAFALGALRGDVVLFLDGLLEEMTPVESAAVLAHEIGHLEDFAARRWQVYGPAPLFVAGGVVTTLGVGGIGWPDWVGFVWAPVVMGTLLTKLVRSQQRETDSDRRAVQLCGDGEALIRALTIIHDRARVPRRFHPEFARQATHPSLARRIQAIRAISGVAPMAVEPRAFAGDGVPRAVVFEADRLVFVTLGDDRPDLGDVSGLVLRARQVEAVPYAELSSLHVDPGRADGAVLVAADRRGDVRRLRIAERDVAAVQATLDIVDLRMGPSVVQQRLPHVTGRMAAVAALVAALPVAAWAVFATALLALIRPAAPILAAMAAGLFVTSAQQARHSPSPWHAAAVALIGGAAAAVALRQQRRDRAADAPFRWDGFLIAGLIVAGVVAALPTFVIAAIGHADLERLHVVARGWSSAAAGWAAFGGLCLAIPRRRARLPAAAAFTLAVAIAAVGSNTFRDRFAPDPLISAAPALAIDDLTAVANGRITVPASHVRVRLGPDARHVVLSPVDDGSDGGRRYTIADFDGWQRSIDADDVQFVDATTLLIARWETQRLRLSTEPVRTAVEAWTLEVDDASIGGAVDVEPSGRWRVATAGDDGTLAQSVRLEGRVGESTVERVVTAAPVAGVDVLVERGVAASGAAIAVRRTFPRSHLALGWLTPELSTRSLIARTGVADPGTIADSRLMVDCAGPSLTAPTATCLATTTYETFVWDVSADAGPSRPIAWMTGWSLAGSHHDDFLTFWREGELLMLWRGTNRAARLSAESSERPAHDAWYAAGHVVTLSRAPTHDEVVRYPMTPPRRQPVTASR